VLESIAKTRGRLRNGHKKGRVDLRRALNQQSMATAIAGTSL